MVHGAALEGNLEGDSPDREATVYLPPTYAADPARRFPVVYLLHGYGGREDTFTDRLAKLQESGDRLSPMQGFNDVIVVTPNAYTLHKGSMYSNSPTTGDWERFVAEDLVAYMDRHYRTLPNRMSRGLGGPLDGRLRCAAHRHAAARRVQRALRHERVLSRGQPRPAARVDGAVGRDHDARAGRGRRARSWLRAVREPGVRRGVVTEPPGIRRSSSTCRSRTARCGPTSSRSGWPTRRSKWWSAIKASLHKFYAVSIEIGTGDTLLAANQRAAARAVDAAADPHAYEEYDGDHTNKVGGASNAACCRSFPGTWRRR